MQSGSRRRRLAQFLPVIILVLGVAGVGLAVNYLWGMRGDTTADAAPPPGKIAVVLNPVRQAAYKRLRIEDLISPANRRLSTIFLDPDRLPEGVLVNPTEIVGRVLARPKPAGFVFTEKDFLPQGTRPGLSAGIPPGKRAMRIAVNNLIGLENLNVGDRFDLVATLPLSEGVLNTMTLAGVDARDLTALDPSLVNWSKQATVDVIVQNGTLVSPMETRTIPVYTSSLTQGAITRTRPAQEVVIAVAPDEVARLTQAIAVGASVQAVIRSGHPDDPEDSVTPNLVPRSPLGGGSTTAGGGYSLMETITGNERRYVTVGSLFPASPEEEQAAPESEPE